MPSHHDRGAPRGAVRPASDRERDLAQRASVAGKASTREAISELSPPPARPELGVHLEGLVKKDFLELDDRTDQATRATASTTS